MEKYPQIKETEEFLVAPTMETGMKEYIRQKFGHFKTREVLTFDDGLAERQAPFLTVARPIATALDRLDAPDLADDDGNITGPDPDEIKCLLEDALVLLGNANVRLNQWRQKKFSEYLTEVGKRTLKAGIPTDKHLFPDEFHKTVLSEHKHAKTNSKLIAAPKPTTSQASFKKPFRPNPQYQSDRRSWGKRKWFQHPGTAYHGCSSPNTPSSSFATTKRARKNPSTPINRS